MFINNKYRKIYFALIEKRKIDPPNSYYEKHHIIPKSLGGSNNHDNIVMLSPREHFVCHLLLTKITSGKSKSKMHWALHRMAFSKTNNMNRYYSSKEYELARKIHSKFLKENHPSKTSDGWTEKVSIGVTESWSLDHNRRNVFADSMKANISHWRKSNEDKFKENQKHAANKSKDKNCQRIEYNGNTYIGWAEFHRCTGLSKGNYLKYYKHGIDPIFRLGKDGPISKSDVEFIITNMHTATGNLQQDLEKALDLNLITEKQMLNFNKGGVRNG